MNNTWLEAALCVCVRFYAFIYLWDWVLTLFDCDACTNEQHDFLQVDAALIATGRAPFTQGLGLENVSHVNWLYILLMLQNIFRFWKSISLNNLNLTDKCANTTWFYSCWWAHESDWCKREFGRPHFSCVLKNHWFILSCVPLCLCTNPLLITRCLIYIALVMLMGRWCLPMQQVHKGFLVPTLKLLMNM